MRFKTGIISKPLQGFTDEDDDTDFSKYWYKRMYLNKMIL